MMKAIVSTVSTKAYGFVYSSKVLGIQVSVQQRSSFHTFPAAVRSPLHVDIESLECESGWDRDLKRSCSQSVAGGQSHGMESGITSWWFQPIWKILVKIGIFPK